MDGDGEQAVPADVATQLSNLVRKDPEVSQRSLESFHFLSGKKK